MKTLIGSILTTPLIVFGIVLGIGYEPMNPSDEPQVEVVESSEHLLAVGEGVCRAKGRTWVPGKRDRECFDVPNLGVSPRVARRWYR
jgi:hypothetical protein